MAFAGRSSDIPTPLSTEKTIRTSVQTIPVPAFSDLSKAANDLINKDFYHTQAANLEVKLKAPNGTAITVKGKQGFDSTTTASLEGKYTLKEQGVTITQSWTTAALLDSKVEFTDVFSQPVKAELQNLWNPNAPQKGAQKLNLTFKLPNSHARAFIDRSASGNVSAILDAVVGHEGFLVGAEAGYDVQKAAVTRYAAAAGYAAPTYTASITGTQNLSVIAASFYQKVNSNVEAGAKATYDLQGNNNVGLEVAGKYKIDPTSFAKAKINDRGIAALAYNTKLNPGATLGLGLSLDTAKLNEAGHKIGTSLTFEG
ncbi:eukaryotic porin/Tom40 [Elsinoe ampelina]|uniref:Eukaryotic porin/Tom40 n=1 Tax=Elsinoe ampelina TaxID=302913 RepID=A0A6A6GCQ4_9PEZI|nr:eukaryotic porin/Tom40 [Elsinoe ampelina]